MTRSWNAIQNEIYFGGATTIPVSVEELERRARQRLSPAAYDYIAGGAGSERTMARNLAAFDAWAILPRVLRDVGERNYDRELFGCCLPAPIALAPVGQLGAVHPDAELASGRAAAGLEIPLILSTVASHTIEDVAEAMGKATRWFQLYWPRDQELAQSFVERAERAGFSALFVTLDTRLFGWRVRDLGHAHLPFLQGIGLANYFSDPVFRAKLERPPEEDLPGAVMEFAQAWNYVSWTWQDLDRLRQWTSLPIVLKGILHPDDARRAMDTGMDGVVVSNHGGRQIDGEISALEALSDVVHGVRSRMPVLFDSGIRRGSDMVKALALGADAVLLGRPYVWGLALEGELGVRTVLRYLLAEFDLTMALAGCAKLADLQPDILRNVQAMPTARHNG